MRWRPSLPGKGLHAASTSRCRGHNHQPSLLGAARCSSSDSAALLSGLVTTLHVPSEGTSFVKYVGLTGFWAEFLGAFYLLLSCCSHWPQRKAALALGFQLQNPSGRVPGKVKVIWFLVGGLVFGVFLWSFLLFFSLFRTGELCTVPPSLLCRKGVSRHRSSSVSASAGAPSHQRDIIWLF